MDSGVMSDVELRAWIAAGILAADGWSPSSEELDAIDNAELTTRLDEAINDATLWLPGQVVVEPRPAVEQDPVAHWVDPGSLDGHDTERLGGLLSALVVDRVESSSVPSTGLYPSLRLRVNDAEDADRLGEVEFEVDTARPVSVVVAIEHDTRPMSWGWPLDVALAGGSDDWLTALRDSSHHPYLYEVRRFETAVDPDHRSESVDSDGPEIAIVDASINPDDLAFDLAATCLIVAGVVEPTEVVLREHVSRFGAAITILMPGAPEQWWSRFFHELCHDNPADVAAALANPDSLSAVPSAGVELTASGYWLVTAGLRHPELAGLANALQPFDFVSENLATNEARTIAGQMDPRPTLEIGSAPRTASAGPEPEDSAPPPDAKRHLIANVIDAEEKSIRSALPPETDLALLIKIAVPSEQDTSDQSRPFSEPEPDDRPSKLEVTVRSEIWSEAKTQEIVLKTADGQRQEPSSPALFEFTTPASGKVVLFDITVSHKGRTLQTGTLQAVVRNRSLSTDKPEFTVNNLSGPDEPSEDASQVDLHLDLRHNGQVRDRQGNPLVAIGAIEDYLDLYDRDFSKVLGKRDAPSSWSEDDGRSLLIRMANHGALFRSQFNTVEGLDDSRSIELLVLAQSKMLPIELMYLGPAPDDDAKLCRHVKRPTKRPTRCRLATAKIVCPYAFLGINTVVSRVIEGGPEDTAVGGDDARTVDTPSHVLYAATHRADDGAAAPTPSDQVEAKANELFENVHRVASWNAWRTEVDHIGDEPRIFVVLGHTELVDNRVRLHIGNGSSLKQAQIDEQYTGADDGSTRSPLVVLMACSSSVANTGPFHDLPASFVLKGAGSVVATLSKINGPQAGQAIETFLDAVTKVRDDQGRLSDAITRTRRELVKQGMPAALVVIACGDIDLKLT